MAQRGSSVYGGDMTTEVRQGLGLVCIGLACLVLSAVADGQPAVVVRAAAMLFTLGGLALAAVGLLRRT